MKTKLASTEAEIKRILQKKCFGDISHVFFGGISQVLRGYIWYIWLIKNILMASIY